MKSDLFPIFSNFSQIEEFLNNNKANLNLSWKAYEPRCLNNFDNDVGTWKKDLNGELDCELFAYSLRRGITQMNESVNKLWTTLEIAHLGKTSSLCSGFDIDFSLGTLLPTLYYSRISLIVSFLSMFGIVSLSSYDNKKEKLLFYNLIRTKNGWRIYERKRYLNDCFGFRSDSWHDQVLKLYFGFADLNIQLPSISKDNTYNLKQKRNEYHYDILKQSSMKKVHADSIRTYFDFLPHTFDSLELGLQTIRRLNACIPLNLGNLESRINTLARAYLTLKHEYKEEIAAWKKSAHDKQKWDALHLEFPEGVSPEIAEAHGLDFWELAYPGWGKKLLTTVYDDL